MNSIINYLTKLQLTSEYIDILRIVNFTAIQNKCALYFDKNEVNAMAIDKMYSLTCIKNASTLDASTIIQLTMDYVIEHTDTVVKINGVKDNGDIFNAKLLIFKTATILRLAKINWQLFGFNTHFVLPASCKFSNIKRLLYDPSLNLPTLDVRSHIIDVDNLLDSIKQLNLDIAGKMVLYFYHIYKKYLTFVLSMTSYHIDLILSICPEIQIFNKHFISRKKNIDSKKMNKKITAGFSLIDLLFTDFVESFNEDIYQHSMIQISTNETSFGKTVYNHDIQSIEIDV